MADVRSLKNFEVDLRLREGELDELQDRITNTKFSLLRATVLQISNKREMEFVIKLAREGFNGKVRVVRSTLEGGYTRAKLAEAGLEMV